MPEPAIDYDALASKFGAQDYVATSSVPVGPPVDYDAIAAKYGATDYVPQVAKPQKAVDYDALAAKYGAIDAPSKVSPVGVYGTPSAALPGTQSPWDLTSRPGVRSGFGAGTVAPAGMGVTPKQAANIPTAAEAQAQVPSGTAVPQVPAPPLPPELQNKGPASPGTARRLVGAYDPAIEGHPADTQDFSHRAEKALYDGRLGDLIPATHAAVAAPLPGQNATEDDAYQYASGGYTDAAKRIADATAKFLANQVNVQTGATIAAGMAAGEIIPLLANAPRVVEALKDVPAVMKGLNIASRAAVPATFGALGVKNVIQQGVPHSLEDATQTALGVLMAGWGTADAIGAGKAVLEGYPQPTEATASGLGKTPITAEQVGGIPTVPPEQAAATAQVMAEQGQRLTAAAWQKLARRTSDQVIPIQTDLGVVHLQPAQNIRSTGTGKSFRYESIKDMDGNTLVGGTPDVVGAWLHLHASQPFGGPLAPLGTLGRWGGTPEQVSTGASDDGSGSGGENSAPPAAPTAPAPPAAPMPPQYNAAEFTKAHNVWNTATNKAAAEYMEQNPGVSMDDAKAAVAGTVGVEPQIDDYKAPPPPPEPPPVVKPEPPAKVGKVSPATPNAPTAATPTEPESPETIALQVQQLGKFGDPIQPTQRKAVMFPGGQGMPDLTTLGGLKITHDEFGNVYAYRPDLIDPSEIRRAAKSNTLTEVLGGPLGMGAPDKANLQGPPVAVVGTAPDGTEAQTTVTDAGNLPQTVVATHAVTPDGGVVEVKTPEQALAERQNPPERLADGTRKWQPGQFGPHMFPMSAKSADGQDVTIMGPAYPDGPGGPDPGQLFVRGAQGDYLTTPNNLFLPKPGLRGSQQREDYVPMAPAPTAGPAIFQPGKGAIQHYTADQVEVANEPVAGGLTAPAGTPASSPETVAPDNSQAIRSLMDEAKSWQRQAATQTGAMRANSLTEAEKLINRAAALSQPNPVTPQVPTGAAGATPLGARQAASAAADHSIDTTQFDTKTIEGRKQLAQEIAAQQATSAVDKSIRDLPVKATVRDGQVTAVVRYQRKPIATVSFPVAEWDATLTHQNPAYPQRQLAVAKLAQTNIADAIDKLWETNERMNPQVVDRLADSLASAVREAVLKPAQPTAQAYPPPPIPGVETTRALEPWFLGQHEGQPVTPERLRDINDRIRNRPDEAVPGRGPRSVGEGESFNQFKDPLIEHVQNLIANYRPGEKILNVTHYRDIQATKAWLKAGAPAQRSIDVDEMTRKGAQEPGGLYHLDEQAIAAIQNGRAPAPDSLRPVNRADHDGIYFLRHGATEWNAENKGPSPNAAEEPGNESAEVFRGASNINLSPQGLQEAHDVADRTAGKFTNIYSSPLKRAQDTAGIVAGRNPQVMEGVPLGYGAGRATAGGQPVRQPNSSALAGELPEGISPDVIAGVTFAGSSEGGRPSGGGDGTVRGEGHGLEPVVRTGESGVGNAPGPVTSGSVTPTEVSAFDDKGDTVVEVNHPPKDPAVVGTSHEHDYRIPDNRIISGSPERRAQNNIAVLKLLQQLDAESRAATMDEKHILASYTGWGGAKQLFTEKPEWAAMQAEVRSLMTPEEFDLARSSTQNAHYTGDEIVDGLWYALRRFGVKPGMSWMEPAVGVGNLLGRQPEDLLQGSRRIGIEKDTTTAKIAKYLYPDSGIDNVPFQNAGIPKDYFDFAASNVPFGKIPIYDVEFRGKPFLTRNIHNYFFAKSLGNVRPGGVIAFITSRYTMDSFGQSSTSFRKWAADRADLIGAIRLPAGAFRTAANTDVITDIIFLRRRIEGQPPEGSGWTDSSVRNFRTPDGRNYGHSVNTYFQEHPEMVLGQQGLQRGEFSDHDYSVKGTVTPDSLKAAIDQLPIDQFRDWAGRSGSARRGVALREIKGASADAKNGALFFDKDGNLFRKLSRGEAVPETASPITKHRIQGQLHLRDIYTALTNAERTGADESSIDQMRALLNDAYDRYVKQHGFLSSRENQKAVMGDPDAPLLPGLERDYDQGNKKEGRQPAAKKAPIFTKRLFGKTEIVEPKNAQEALSATLSNRGFLDWDHLKEISGLNDQQLHTELAGLIYQDPQTKQYQTADEYLSGSVRTKLRAAEAIARVEPNFEENVRALQAAQPEDVPPSRIKAMLGVTWVPLQTYSQFLQETLGLRQAPTVAHFGNEWATGVEHHPTTKWDTKRVSAGRLIDAALNLRRVKVYDRGDGGRPVINVTETAAASQRQKELNEHFNAWLFSDPERGDAMVRIYNDLQNDLRLRSFDGSHLTLPGMSRTGLRTGNLEPYQLGAVWRQIVQKNVLLNHAPGAGKSFECIAAGMELKRLGLIQRPMYVVPNSTLGGWQDQFATLYPSARALVFSETDLAKDKRRAAVARMATGDWDAVVVPHSSFQFIPVGDEIFQQHYNALEKELTDQIMEAEDAGLDTRMVTRLERAKDRLLTSLQERRNSNKQDNVINWEQLGIDQMFVDESQVYKKLGFSTKQPGVAGIDYKGNQRTFDLRMKVKYTQSHGRGVVFASGTPVTNTMGEIHSIMRYLIEPELEARGIAKFDDWAAEFGRIVDTFEPKPEGGGYHVKARFAKFVNLPRLATLLRTFTDVMTSDMLDIPRPSIVGGTRRVVVTEMNDDQREFQHSLQGRASAIRSNPRKAMPDNMLVVFGDGGKMAMDARMVNANAADDPNGRLSKVAENVHHLWKQSAENNGTQLVFLDMGVPADARAARRASASGRPSPGARTDFSPYDEIMRKLQDLGVPRNEIAHMGMAKNKQQRRQLFQKVNEGKIRVLIGSSDKMGIGVNVQAKGYGLHHVDVPARPDILDQREARFIRQGNGNPEVHILYYTTKGTLDENKFGNVVRKGKFINNLWKGDFTQEEAEDLSDGVPSWEMFQALTSGDPRILRKLEVDSEVDRLSRLQWAFHDQMYEFRRRLQQAREEVDRLTVRQRYLNEAKSATENTGRVWNIGGQKFSGEGISERVGAALLDAAAKKNGTIGTAHGLDISVSHGDSGEAKITISSGPVVIGQEFLGPWMRTEKEIADNKKFNATHHNVDPAQWRRLPEESSAPGTLATRLENDIKGVGASIESAAAAKQRNLDEIAMISKDTGQTWPYQADYDKLVAEQEQLQKDLGVLKDDQSAIAMDNGEEVVDDAVQAEAEPTDEDEEDEDGPGGTALYRPRVELAGPTWYSQLERTIADKMPAKASPAQVAAIIGNPQNGVKPDEVKWTGLRDWLHEQTGPVTKEQVLDFVRANGVKVAEVMHGGAKQTTDAVRALYDKRDDIIGELRQMGINPNGTDERYGWALVLTQDLEQVRREIHEASSVGGPTRFQKYTTPGGRDYGELIMTLPQMRKPGVTTQWGTGENVNYNLSSTGGGRDVHTKEWHSADGTARITFEPHRGYVANSTYLQNADLGNPYHDTVDSLTDELPGAVAEKFDEMRNRKDINNTGGPVYTSTHWPGIENPIAHIRFNSRRTPDGEKVLHLEEVQSDFGQQARTKGVQPAGEEKAALEKELAAADAAHAKAFQEFREVRESKRPGESNNYSADLRPLTPYAVRYQAADQKATELGARVEAIKAKLRSGVPAAPFQKTWQELAFRRALRYASENGFDRLSWTTGKTQGERYDLSKQVDRVTWEPTGGGDGQLAAYKDGKQVMFEGTTESKLPDYIGKDVARKLLEQPTMPRDPSKQELTGSGLRVEATGMNEFYDQILPRYAAKLGAKWGAKVEDQQIITNAGEKAKYSGPEMSLKEFADWIRDIQKQWEPRPWVTQAAREWNVTLNQQAMDAYKAMQSGGESFTDAIQHHGSPGLAEKVGGSMTFKKQRGAETVHSLQITPAMADSVLGGQALFRPKVDLMDDQAAATPEEFLNSADAKYERLSPGYGHIYVNQSGGQVIAEALERLGQSEGPLAGVTLDGDVPEALIKVLRRMRGRAFGARAAALDRIIGATRQALNDDPVLTYVDAGNGMPIQDIQATRREEVFHRAQLRLTPSSVDHLKSHVAIVLLADPDIASAIQDLRVKRGVPYSDNKAILELGAVLGSGQGAEINRTPAQAATLFRQYMNALIESEGPRAGTVLKYVPPKVRKELGDDYVRERWNGNYPPKFPARLLRRPGRGGAITGPGTPAEGTDAGNPIEAAQDAGLRGESEAENKGQGKGRVNGGELLRPGIRENAEGSGLTSGSKPATGPDADNTLARPVEAGTGLRNGVEAENARTSGGEEVTSNVPARQEDSTGLRPSVSGRSENAGRGSSASLAESAGTNGSVAGTSDRGLEKQPDVGVSSGRNQANGVVLENAQPGRQQGGTGVLLRDQGETWRARAVGVQSAIGDASATSTISGGRRTGRRVQGNSLPDQGAHNTPLSSRARTAAINELGLNPADYDTKTIDGRKQLDAAIHTARSVTLGSGLGALQPAYEAAAREIGEFAREDLAPAAKVLIRASMGWRQSLQSVFAPQTINQSGKDTALRMRAMYGKQLQARDRAKAAFESFKTAFFKYPADLGVHALDVIDAIEDPENNAYPDALARNYGEAVRREYDRRWQRLNDLGRLNSYLANYYTHLYKDPTKAAQFVENWQQRRPIAGTERFRKQRIYPTFREALENGLQPKFDNPVDYLYAGLAQMDKAIFGHEFFNEMRPNLKFSRHGAPANYPIRIDDALFTVFGPRRGAVSIDPNKQDPVPRRVDFFTPEELDQFNAGTLPTDNANWERYDEAVENWKQNNVLPEDVTVHGQRIMGRYYAPDGAGQVINNHLSPQWQGKTPFDTLMTLKGVMNALQLGFSYFHGVTTAYNSVLSDIALGMKQMAAGHPVRGITSIALSPHAIIRDQLKGKRLVQAWDGTLKDMTPDEAATVFWLQQAGGSPHQAAYNERYFREGLERSIAKGSALRTAVRLANPLLWAEWQMAPVMSKLVPRAKISAFMRAIQEEMLQNPDASLTEIREHGARIWDSMDNRFGQLNQRNMLMRGWATGILNTLMGRPGWTIGSLREGIGGVYDIGKGVYGALKGEPFELSHRSAGLLAMIGMGMFVSGLLTYLLTGTAPKGVDFIDPRTGGIDEEGNPARLVMPGYWSKDIYNWSTAPGHTAKSKLTQVFQIIADLTENRDYQRRKIWGDGGIGLERYLKNQVIPYSAQGIAQNLERGNALSDLKTLLPLAGVQPANRRVGYSRAQRMISDWKDEQASETRSLPSNRMRARSRVFIAAEKDLRGKPGTGKPGAGGPGSFREADKIGKQEIAAGNLKPADVRAAEQRAKIGPLAAEYKGITDLATAMRVYDAATPDEQRSIHTEALSKVSAAARNPTVWKNPDGDPDTPTINIVRKYFPTIVLPRTTLPPAHGSQMGSPQPIW